MSYYITVANDMHCWIIWYDYKDVIPATEGSVGFEDYQAAFITNFNLKYAQFAEKVEGTKGMYLALGYKPDFIPKRDIILVHSWFDTEHPIRETMFPEFDEENYGKKSLTKKETIKRMLEYNKRWKVLFKLSDTDRYNMWHQYQKKWITIKKGGDKDAEK